MTGPTAAPAHFPYRHRTVLEVDYDDAKAAWKQRYRENARVNQRNWRTKPRA